jgi:hypothetical protein
MRENAMVLLAAAASFMFATAGVARAQPNLQRRVEYASPELSSSADSGGHNSQALGDDPGTGSGPHGSIGTPRMIIWRLCSSPSSGSALSVYFTGERPVQSFQDSARQEGDYSDGCSDREEGSDESFVTTPIFADQKSADQHLSSHVIRTASTIQVALRSM